MMSTLLIHMCSNSVAKWSPLSRGICLDHIWSKSAVWQSPPMRGICLDHIWSKSAVGQSPPTRGTFWTTFGWSPLRDKVHQWGAQLGPHLVEVRWVSTIWASFGWSPLRDKVLRWGSQFGPHLVEVHCVTKSSDEGHNLDHIWSKSAVRQSPPTRGIIFFPTFGHCPLRDNVFWWLIMGIILLPHLTKVRCVTRPQTN